MVQSSRSKTQAPTPALENVPAAALRLEKVPVAARRLALSVPAVYRNIKAGRLGPLVKLGARSSALCSDCVDAFIAARIAEAKHHTTGAKTGGAA